MPYKFNPFTSNFDLVEGNLDGYAGSESISTATGQVIITFATALLTNNYAPLVSIRNTVDADPIFLQCVVTAKSTTGFTVRFNANTDSANYVLDWGVIKHV